MFRLLTAFVLAAAFVALLMFVGSHSLATPIPFWLLLPGLLAGAAVPGSGFVFKENNPWSPLATFVLYAVNILLYGGVTYLFLYARRKKPQRSPDARPDIDAEGRP